MKLRVIYNCLLILVFASISERAKTQDFEWETVPKGNSKTGFYKILLKPGVVSHLNSAMGDIRIYDAENKEIPYLLESEKPLTHTDYFVEYKILEKKEQDSWPYYTRIVIHNPAKNTISNIHLIIQNSDVSKSLKLSGSNNKVNWYIIKDNYRFQSMYSDQENSVIRIIDFPRSNYEYYEILIDDWKNNPINILRAGFFNTSVEKGKYTALDQIQFSQLELKEEKQSLVKINFSGPLLFHKLNFRIEGPEFYYRRAEIQVRDSVMDKRKKFDYFFRTVTDVILSSNSSNTFYFENLKAKNLYVRIFNFDDQPVRIKEVGLEQLNHYLVCRLDSSKNYLIRFGNSKMNTPVYDIQFFTDKIPDKIPIIQTGEIVQSGKSAIKVPVMFHLDRIYLWMAIIAVVLILLYMISKMLKEMKSGTKTS